MVKLWFGGAIAFAHIIRSTREFDMPQLIIVCRDGSERAVEGDSGISVMQVVREHGFDEMLALCGGCCACATCHVHVDPAFADKLPPMSADENDLLGSSSHRDATSRLSCQVKFTQALDGLTLRIAEED
jgi:2Fe-2S ferredoxin